MIHIIRTQAGEDGFTWVRLATQNNSRVAVALATSIETSDIEAYVEANTDALKARILAKGKIDKRLTARLRAHEARQLLQQSRLEGKTLEQVQNYIENNVKDFATAKAALKEVAGQTWMLYQVAQLMFGDPTDE